MNPESNFTRREKNHSPIPLKYFDVSRTAHTNLDVEEEKRIDDYWNIGGSRDLSDSWTSFAQFTLIERKTSRTNFCGSGERSSTKNSLTSKPNHLWPELWDNNGKDRQAEREAEVVTCKSSISITHENCEESISLTQKTRNSKRPIKNARKKLETPVAPAMPCKIMKKNCVSGASNKIKTKLASILEADESTRLRMGESLPKRHEDHIAGKGNNSLQHYNLVHKFISMPQAIKFPAAKAAMDKEWEKVEKILAWNLTKVRSKKEVIDEARTSGAKVHFASLMDICHLKNAELEAKHQKYKGRVVLRGDIVNR